MPWTVVRRYAAASGAVRYGLEIEVSLLMAQPGWRDPSRVISLRERRGLPPTVPPRPTRQRGQSRLRRVKLPQPPARVHVTTGPFTAAGREAGAGSASSLSSSAFLKSGKQYFPENDPSAKARSRTRSLS